MNENFELQGLKLTKAELETSNFVFEAYGSSNIEAKEALVRLLNKHAEQYRLDTDWYSEYLEDVSYIEFQVGQGFRDRELVTFALDDRRQYKYSLVMKVLAPQFNLDISKKGDVIVNGDTFEQVFNGLIEKINEAKIISWREESNVSDPTVGFKLVMSQWSELKDKLITNLQSDLSALNRYVVDADYGSIEIGDNCVTYRLDHN